MTRCTKSASWAKVDECRVNLAKRCVWRRDLERFFRWTVELTATVLCIGCIFSARFAVWWTYVCKIWRWRIFGRDVANKSHQINEWASARRCSSTFTGAGSPANRWRVARAPKQVRIFAVSERFQFDFESSESMAPLLVPRKKRKLGIKSQTATKRKFAALPIDQQAPRNGTTDHISLHSP